MRILWALLLSAGAAFAEGEKAGEFEYYILSLSWSPTWCALEGDQRDSPQCFKGTNFGWVLHGLWPQNDTGWPSYCPTDKRSPSRAVTEEQADIFGSSGNAWYQWNKHGRCTGLSADDYYLLARKAYDEIAKPEIFNKLGQPIRLPAHVVEEAFLEANPKLKADQITITCKSGRIQEARICLTRDLTPRRCGEDVISDCMMPDALLDPVR